MDFTQENAHITLILLHSLMSSRQPQTVLIPQGFKDSFRSRDIRLIVKKHCCSPEEAEPQSKTSEDRKMNERSATAVHFIANRRQSQIGERLSISSLGRKRPSPDTFSCTTTLDIHKVADLARVNQTPNSIPRSLHRPSSQGESALCRKENATSVILPKSQSCGNRPFN
jgi:hypothetical protein